LDNRRPEMAEDEKPKTGVDNVLSLEAVYYSAPK
jgi:hypothetical protein